MTFIPMTDKALVRPFEENNISKHGLQIVSSIEATIHLGEVIAVGAGRKNDNGVVIPMDVKVGDIVIYNRFAGTKLSIGDVKHLLIREEELLAITDDPKADIK